MGEHFIGIDFGATNTRIGVREDGSDVIKLHRGPGLRITDVTIDEIAEAIVELVVTASGKSQTQIRTGRVVVGLPGIQMTDTVKRTEIKEAAERLFADADMNLSVAVMSNWKPLLHNTCKNGTGVVTIVGSGNASVFQKINKDTGKLEYERNGGWGTRFGDPASGIALAEFGLRQLCHDIEERRFSGITSKLLTVSETTLGIYFDDVTKVNDFRDKHRPEAFCQTFLRAVKLGDERCMEIFVGEMKLLMTQIRRTFPATTSVSEMPYAIAGGLMEDPLYKETVHAMLHEQFPGLVIQTDANAVLGAIQMAAEGLAD